LVDDVINSIYQIEMPCACLLPPEIYPDASEWGPLLWTVIHGLAEKAGTCSIPQFYPDERRELIRIFKVLEKVIPCPSCKEHYEVYLREHPVDKAMNELPRDKLNTYVKTWFWELHNWVNESLRHPQFPYEQLAVAYGSTNIRAALKSLDIPMRRAIRVRSGQLVSYNEFLRHVNTLLSIY
jgi:hypothetical protein